MSNKKPKTNWANQNMNRLECRLDRKLILRFGHYKKQNDYNTTEALNNLLDKHLPQLENNA
tara:strand:- start:1314 stop:1496 length:183 start_codon:yes stop_codon:yes gene_type:complete